MDIPVESARVAKDMFFTAPHAAVLGKLKPEESALIRAAVEAEAIASLETLEAEGVASELVAVEDAQEVAWDLAIADASAELDGVAGLTGQTLTDAKAAVEALGTVYPEWPG